jgi:hypothetical protein
MNHVRCLVVISTLMIALSGPAMAQYTAMPPGNGQLQPGWTQQQPHVPVPRPRPDESRLPPDPGGQHQSHLLPDPGPPQLGGYDAPVGRSEPDHTELETCLSAAARRLKATATVAKLMAACSIEVDQWMDQCVQGGTPAGSCASLWGSLATDAEKAAQGRGYQRSSGTEQR